MATRRLNAPSYSPPFNPAIAPVQTQDKSATPTAGAKPVAVGTGPVPYFMENLRERRMMFDFLELSYRGGPAYKYGKDPRGMNVLIEHENERVDPVLTSKTPTASEVVNRTESALKSDKYARRLRMASFVNYVKPIEDKFRSYALSSIPSRPEIDEVKAAIVRIKLEENIDAMVADGLRFMEAWIGFDAKRIAPTEGRNLPTKLDLAKQDPVHQGAPYIVRVDPRRVVDFEESGGDVVRVVIEEEVKTKGSFTAPSSTRLFYREWTATNWTLYELETDSSGKQKLVRKDGNNHEFGVCPFRRVCFPFPSDDVCDLNRQDFNIGSLLDEEMYQNTFSQRVITGSTAEDVAMTDRGAGNTMVLKEPDSKVTVIAGDPDQAKTIMQRRSEIREAIFNIVSMDPTTKNVAESAEKKKRDLESLYTLLTKIIEVIEKAENWLLVSMEVYSADDQQQRTKYSRQVDVYSVDDLLAQLAEVGKVSFAPPELKRRLALSLAQKVDPFGPHDEYKEEVEEMFDTNPQVVEALMSMKREGALTPEMLVTSLGVSDALAKALIEMMEHPDPMDPNDPGSSDAGSDEEDPDAVRPVPGGKGDGPSGEDDGGSGSKPASDSSPDGATDGAKPRGGKARRVRRGKPGGGDQ